MIRFIYSRNFGWNPLKFLLKGKNFYKERTKWAEEQIKVVVDINIAKNIYE